jgi:hypothetical protein
MPAEYPETDPELILVWRLLTGKREKTAYQLKRRTSVLQAAQAALAIKTPFA